MTDRLNPEALDKMKAAVAEAISETTYTCSRVWEAWHYGTMTDEDFEPAWEDETLLTEVVQAVLAALPAPVPETVNSVEELDQLPYGSFILDNMEEVGKVRKTTVYFLDSNESHPKKLVAELFLPATVLWVPTEGGGE